MPSGGVPSHCYQMARNRPKLYSAPYGCHLKVFACLFISSAVHCVSMEWSKEAIDILIEAYRHETCLYDTKSPMYHNKHARKSTLDRIVDALKEVRFSSHGDIIAKMKSLRTTFVSEMNKIKSSTKSGMGSADVYQPTVWYFKKLLFLRDHVQTGKGTFSADFSQESEDHIKIMDVTDECHISETSKSLVMSGDYIVLGECDLSQDDQTNETAAVATSSSSLYSTPCGQKGTKRKSCSNDEENAILKKADNILSSLNKQKDAPPDLEAFGSYVTASLQQIKSKALIMKAKREIFNTLCDVQEEDLSINE